MSKVIYYSVDILVRATNQFIHSLLAQYHNKPLLPKKNLHWHCFRFLSQEKLQTMIMQNFGGKRGVLWDSCKWRIKKSLFLVPEITDTIWMEGVVLLVLFKILSENNFALQCTKSDVKSTQ